MMAQPTPPWRAQALALALSGHVDATTQQRAVAHLLEQGAPCRPEQVVHALWHAGDGGARATAEVVQRGRARLTALAGRFVVLGDPDYPAPLRSAWPELGAPLWLFTSGRPKHSDITSAVAVVGTRRPTLDGLHTARTVAAALARAGAVVVSGLARGIDQAAHRAALDAGGCTVAVLGTGLGVDYPSGSASLRAEICDHGGLVTELPPGAGPRPWHFLARNRIISGLSTAIVVVEGGPTSGALQTARLAAAQGRDVWAVPGSINASTSQAPLALLRDGALPLTGVDVLLDSLGLSGSGGVDGRLSGRGGVDGRLSGRGGVDGRPAGRVGGAAGGLSGNARVILGFLGAVPATTDALVAASSLPAHATMTALAELIESGCAAATARGVVRA